MKKVLALFLCCGAILGGSTLVVADSKAEAPQGLCEECRTELYTCLETETESEKVCFEEYRLCKRDCQ